MVLGGRWAESSAFVRRRMKGSTTPLSSRLRSAPRACCASDESGSRPARMGDSYFLWNSEWLPSTPGLAKLTMA